ncbi:MAG: hypothetical protein V3R73_04555, partial [Sphingomonadales bacterium]
MRRLADLALLSGALTLASCGISTDYRDIKPRYEVRNAPVPVPKPRAKPESIKRKAEAVKPQVKTTP